MTVPVFYSISDDFTKYAAVSLNSLVKHASSDTDYTVYFLSQDLSDEHIKDLSDLGNENVHVKFFHIDGIDYQILVEADFLVNIMEDRLSDKVALSAYHNIFRTACGKKICREMFALKEE